MRQQNHAQLARWIAAAVYTPARACVRRPTCAQAGKDKGDDAFPDRWKLGGPLVPDLDTALHHYPHT